MRLYTGCGMAIAANAQRAPHMVLTTSAGQKRKPIVETELLIASRFRRQTWTNAASRFPLDSE